MNCIMNVCFYNKIENLVKLVWLKTKSIVKTLIFVIKSDLMYIHFLTVQIEGSLSLYPLAENCARIGTTMMVQGDAKDYSTRLRRNSQINSNVFLIFRRFRSKTFQHLDKELAALINRFFLGNSLSSNSN